MSVAHFLLVDFRGGYSCCYLLVRGGNKVNFYSVQLKFSWECKFGVEFDNNSKVLNVLEKCKIVQMT